MKKLFLTLTLAAFAIGVQAGESKDSKAASACSGDKAKAACTASKSACAAKTACCKGEISKKALLSPKAAADAGK